MATILVVDDNLTNIEVLLDSLADEGYEVLTASSGVDALRIAGQRLPDCILLDIAMPEINGLEVCRLLKVNRRTRPIPVIIVSALDAIDDVVAGLDVGADDYVVKPFNLRIIRARTRAALRAVESQRALDQANDLLFETNQKLAEKNRQLSESYQTAHTFVDHVSHELRTPLQVIRDVASIVSDGLAGPVTDRQQEFLQMLHSNVEDLVLMSDDMLDTSRLEAGFLVVRRRTSTVAGIVQKVRPTLERLASTAGVELVVQLPDSLPDVFCDEDKVGRIVINLVANAMKYSGEGTQVTISAEADGKRPLVRFGVTDNGPGIDEAQLSIIFDRFRQVSTNLRASAQGVGLGLNIAQELARLNFGTLSVQSRVGEGSEFSFTLPTSNLHSLLDQHLTHVCESNAVAKLICLLATVPIGADGDALDDVYEFLVRAVRNTDLVVPLAGQHWLIIVDSADGQPESLIHRIRDAWREHCDHDGQNHLPDLDFRALGQSLTAAGIAPLVANLQQETCLPMCAGAV